MKFLLIILVACSVFANNTLLTIPPNTWYQAPNTKLIDVCPDDPLIHGVVGCPGIVSYSGGAMDQDHDLLYVWGGGHTDYSGNEVYVFNVDSLHWSRVTEPLSPPIFSQDPAAPGQPVSRHTYDGLAYIPTYDRLFAYGGSMADNGWATNITWTFDPTSLIWSDMSPNGNDNRPSTNCCNFTSAYDPATNMVYMRDPYYLDGYSFTDNTWYRIMEWPHTWSPQKSIVDESRHIFLTIGRGEVLAYDIMARTDVSSDWVTSGTRDVVDSYAAGIAYHPALDKLFSFIGGGIYTLDLATKVWTHINTGGPAEQNETGTYGRFQYSSLNNVFVLVNSVTEDVWFYKPPAAPVSVKKTGNKKPLVTRYPKHFLNGRAVK